MIISVLQLVVFLCICCLIPRIVTHSNQDEEKGLNNKHSNQNSPDVEDFYFDEQKADDKNVKSGRVIPQSTWSNEDKKQTQPVENKTDTQFSDEFSLQNVLSYLLNVVHELKKDIFGIKEMKSLKSAKELENSFDNLEQNSKLNKVGENHDASKYDDSTENTEIRNKSHQPKSNYITDYYQKNGIKFNNYEEKDEDLENSSDVSDDSSHKPNERINMHEVSKNNENAHNFKCMKIKRKADKYSFKDKKTTTISTSQTKISEEGVNENEPYVPETSSKNRTYRKQQEQITSPKPEDQKRTHDNAKSLKIADRTNERTTVSSRSHKAVSEIPNNKMSTEGYTFGTEINDSPKESEGEKSKIISNHTTVTYNENKTTSKTDGEQTSNRFNIGNTIAPTTFTNTMKAENLNKDPSDNLSDKRGTNKNDESEKSNDSKQDKNASKAEEDSENEETKAKELNDDSEPEKSSKNKKLNYSNPGNNNKEEDYNLVSTKTNDLSQDSNSEILNHDVTESKKLQGAQKNNENLYERAAIHDEDSPDQEYDDEEDNEDFDICDELNDMQDFNQDQEDELNTHNESHGSNDEMNAGNTVTFLTNKSQISQHTGYVMEEKSQEQYDTFLEYFYKHSNSPLFLSLKNQSNNFYKEKDGF